MEQTFPRKNIWLHRYALLSAFVGILVIVAGAIVTTIGAGDAVPDWPLAYSLVFPPMVGGILYEHGHRLIAGVLTIMLVICALTVPLLEKRREIRRFAWWAAWLVVAQAIIGGLRVLVVSQEPLQRAALNITGVEHVEPVRIGFAVLHALCAQLVICLVFCLAAITSRRWESWINDFKTNVSEVWRRKQARFSLLLMLAILFQLLMGAMMRHSGAGVIVPDYPTVYGKLLPNAATLREDMLDYNKRFDTARVDRGTYGYNTLSRLTGGEIAFKVGTHFAHRTWAWAVFALLLLNHLRAKRQKETPPFLKKLALLMAGLGMVQVGLGISVLMTEKSLFITVGHVATGATILGLSAVQLLGWNTLKKANAPETMIEPISQGEKVKVSV